MKEYKKFLLLNLAIFPLKNDCKIQILSFYSDEGINSQSLGLTSGDWAKTFYQALLRQP